MACLSIFHCSSRAVLGQYSGRNPVVSLMFPHLHVHDRFADSIRRRDLLVQASLGLILVLWMLSSKVSWCVVAQLVCCWPWSLYPLFVVFHLVFYVVSVGSFIFLLTCLISM